ncbi:MAG: hypothetical protein LBL00_01450, partial [Endomicrobium sp.]|nr:hypothetical protein [Endomicrobium sp.]
IEGINKSFSDKLIPYSNKNAGQDDSKQGEVVAKMDFIPVLSENQTQNKKNIKSFSAFLLYIAPEDKRFAVDENLNVRFRADRSIVFVFLVLLLSYISFKKPKDEYGIFEKYLI